MRPNWNDYFMNIAFLASTRATCDRKKVGAVIVDPNDHSIISTGYNGSPAGMPHCDDVGHEMKEIDGRPSCIRTLHAESNALDFAGAPLPRDGILYGTAMPCYDCAKRIVNARISRVYYAEYYASRNTDLVEEYFERSPTKLLKWEGNIVVPNFPDEIRARTVAEITGLRQE